MGKYNSQYQLFLFSSVEGLKRGSRVILGGRLWIVRRVNERRSRVQARLAYPHERMWYELCETVNGIRALVRK